MMIAREQRLAELRERLVRDGPATLLPRDRMALLSDLVSMVALHEEVWSAPSSRLGSWWRLALEHYHVVAPLPQTAFVQTSPKGPPRFRDLRRFNSAENGCGSVAGR